MKIMTVSNIIQEIKIDFTKTVIVFYLAGTPEIDYFQIRPKNFIRFAKDDFKIKDKKGFINSLTNAKRAIDCQIDTIYKSFGISFDNIPSASEELIKAVFSIKKDSPHKLKLIQALKVAPSGLINKVRNLRNKLEHYYQIPSENEVEEAIEIAELFILSCENSINIINDHFVLTSENFSYQDDQSEISKYYHCSFSNQLSIKFNSETRQIELTPMINKVDKQIIYLDQKMQEFYFFLQLIITREDNEDFFDSLKLLLKFIKHPIPEKNIQILQYD